MIMSKRHESGDRLAALSFAAALAKQSNAISEELASLVDIHGGASVDRVKRLIQF